MPSRFFEGLAKLGAIVAKTLLRKQMFLSLAKQMFAVRNQVNVFASSQKHFRFVDATSAQCFSATATVIEKVREQGKELDGITYCRM